MKLNISKLNFLYYGLFCMVFAAFSVLLFSAQKYTHYPTSVEEIVLIDNTMPQVKDSPSEKGGKYFPHVDKTVFKILGKNE